MNIKLLLALGIGLIIGLLLFPIVRNATSDAYEESLNRENVYWFNSTDNATSLNGTTTNPSSGYQLLNLVPFAYILLIIGGAVTGGYFAFKE